MSLILPSIRLAPAAVALFTLMCLSHRVACSEVPENSSTNPIRSGPLYRRQVNSYGQQAQQSSADAVTLATLNSQLSALITIGHQTQQKLDALDHRFRQFESAENQNREHLRNQVQELQHKLGSVEWTGAKLETSLDELKDTISELGDNLRSVRPPVGSPQASFVTPSEEKLNALLVLSTTTRSAVNQNYNELLRLSTNITHLLASTNSVRVQLRAIPTKQFISTSIDGLRSQPLATNSQSAFPSVQSPFPQGLAGSRQIAAGAKEVPTGCSEVTRNNSGIHLVRTSVDSSNTFFAYCDTIGVGSKWTVILNRADGETNFYRNWAEYRNGFGNVNADFWIGLDKLNEITSSRLHELLVTLEDFEGEVRTASYTAFAVSGEKEDYALNVLGKYEGNAGDSLSYHAGQKFSTFDEDNDLWTEGNCAQSHTGGWWYNACDMTNLGGKYLNGAVDAHARNQGIYWNDFHGPEYSLKSVRMLIRPVA